MKPLLIKPMVVSLVWLIGTVSGALLAVPERATAQPAGNPAPLIVVLKVDGSAEYRKPTWTAPQPLQPGLFLSPTDYVYSQNAALTVQCPDGSVQVFQRGTRFKNDIITCPPGLVVFGKAGEKHVLRQKGGAQTDTAPYLIFPRATVIRTRRVTLRWNAVADAESYTVAVSDGTRMTRSERLLPASVMQGRVATWALPIDLAEKTAYSAVICVRYTDMRERCTNNDPDWETNADLSFYYVQTPALDAAENALSRALHSETPDVLLFARVMLLSCDVPISEKQALGVYGEAIPLLEEFLQTYPNSILAQSPEAYLLQGDLYRAVALPQSAQTAYERAARLSIQGSEVAARAALGIAMVTADAKLAVAQYEEGLQVLEKLLSKAAYDERLQELCDGAGDLKFDLKACEGK